MITESSKRLWTTRVPSRLSLAGSSCVSRCVFRICSIASNNAWSGLARRCRHHYGLDNLQRSACGTVPFRSAFDLGHGQETPPAWALAIRRRWARVRSSRDPRHCSADDLVDRCWAPVAVSLTAIWPRWPAARRSSVLRISCYHPTKSDW